MSDWKCVSGSPSTQFGTLSEGAGDSNELEQMRQRRARRSPQEWNDFLDSFVDDELLVARIKAKSRR
ncbi:hypothetical protein GHK43_01610 [Sinorhizobium meliloti]|nr:hypothetical protein [Sinorhizobium meliloti]